MARRRDNSRRRSRRARGEAEAVAECLPIAGALAARWAARAGLERDDAVQIASMAMLRAVRSWRAGGGARRSSWVYAAVHHEMVSQARRRSRRLPSVQDLCGCELPAGSGERAVAGDDGVETAELAAWLMAGLPPELKAAARMTICEDLTCRHAARLLGVSAQTVGDRRRRALAAMRSAAAKAGLVCPAAHARDATPDGRDAARDTPDATPGGRDAARDTPDATPGGRDATPDTPDATPGGRDAAPDKNT